VTVWGGQQKPTFKYKGPLYELSTKELNTFNMIQKTDLAYLEITPTPVNLLNYSMVLQFL
jgi:hypothetical protein